MPIEPLRPCELFEAVWARVRFDDREDEPSIMSCREQLATLQNRLLELQHLCTHQALAPDEDDEDCGPKITRLQDTKVTGVGS